MAELKKKIAERESLKNNSIESREPSPALSHGHEDPTPPPPPPMHPPAPLDNGNTSYKPAAPAAAIQVLQQQQQQLDQHLDQQGISGNNNKRQKIENNPFSPGHQANTNSVSVRGGEDPMRALPKPSNPCYPGLPPWCAPTTTTSAAAPAPIVSGQQQQFQLPDPSKNPIRVALTQPQLDAALLEIQHEKQQTLARRDGLVQLLQEADRAYETLCAQEYTLIVQNTGLEGLLQQQQWQPPPPPLPPLLPTPLPPPPAGEAPLAVTAGNITATKITDKINNKNNRQPPPPPPIQPPPGSMAPPLLPLPLSPPLPLARNVKTGNNKKTRKIELVDVVDLAHEEEKVQEIPPPPPAEVQQQAQPPPRPLIEASAPPSVPQKEVFIPEYDAVSRSLLKLQHNDSFIKRANLARSTRPFTTLLLSPSNITLDPTVPTLDIPRSFLGYSFDLGGYYLRPQGRFINALKKQEGELLPPIVDNKLTAVDKKNDLLTVNLAVASAQQTYSSILLKNKSGNCEAMCFSNSDCGAAEQSKARTAATEHFLKIMKSGLEKKPNSHLLWPFFLQAYLSQPSINAFQARAMIDTAARLAPGYTTWLAAAAKAPTAISAAVVLHRGAVTLVQSDKKNARKAKLSGTVLDLVLRAVRCTSAQDCAASAAPTAPVVSTLCQWHASWCSPPWPLPPSTEPASPLVLHPEQRELILHSLQPHAIMLCMLWSSLAFAAAYDRLPTPVEHRLGEQQQAIGLEWPFSIPTQRLHFVASALEQGLQALRITPAVYYKYIEHLEDSEYVPKYSDPIEMARSCYVDTIRRFGHRSRNQRPLYFPGDPVVKSPNTLDTAFGRKLRANGKPLPENGVSDSHGQDSTPIKEISSSSFPSPSGVVPKSVDRVLVASSHSKAAEVLAREDHEWPCGGDVALALSQACSVIERNLGSDDKKKEKNEEDTKPRGGAGGGSRGDVKGVLPSSLDKEGRNKFENDNGSDMEISFKDEDDQEGGEDQEEGKQRGTRTSGHQQNRNMLRRSFWVNQAKVLINPAATTPILPKSPSQLQWPPVEPRWLRGGAAGHLPLALEAGRSNSPDYLQVGALVSKIKDLPGKALLPVYEELQYRRRLNGTPAAAEICVALLRRAIHLAAADGAKEDEGGDGDGDASLQPGEDTVKERHRQQQEEEKLNGKKARRGGGSEDNPDEIYIAATAANVPASASVPASVPASSLLMSSLPATATPTRKEESFKDVSFTLNFSDLKVASQNGSLSKSPLVSWALPAAAGALVSSTPPAAASLWLEAIHLTALLSTASARELLEAAVAVHPLNSVLKEAGEAVVRDVEEGMGTASLIH